MRRRWAFALLLPQLAGCSGDDSNVAGAPTDASTADASTRADASMTDGAGGDANAADAADASPDAGGDAALPTLACTTWLYPQAIVLEDLTGGAFFGGQLWVGEPVSGQVRVILQPSTGPALRMYGFDKATSVVSSLDGPTTAEATYESARRFAASATTLALVQDEATLADAGTSLTLTAFSLPDALTTSGSLPAAMPLSPGGFEMAAFPEANGGVFTAVVATNASEPPAVDYALSVGVATPAGAASLATIALSPDVDAFENLSLAHANGNAYLFTSNSAEVGGEALWIVADTGTFAAPPAALTFDTAAGARVIDVATSAAGGATNVAYVSAASDGSLVVRAGQVVDAKIDGVTAADLTVVRSYADLTTSPVSAGSAAWYGDDLMAIAPGLPGEDGGEPAGVNLLWMDARGDVRAEEVGKDALLQGEGTSVSVAVAAPAAVSAGTASWDVAWIETRSSGERVLLFNELECE